MSIEEEEQPIIEYTPAQLKFIAYWEKERQHKLRYMLMRGGLFIGVPIGIFNYFWDSINFDLALFDFWKLMISVAVFGFAGVMFGLYRFGVRDKNYKMLVDTE